MSESWLDDLVEKRAGDLRVLQPTEAAELPDDGSGEWAPLLPYWAVMWQSGVALAREIEAGAPDLGGKRVIELGCGLGLPSLAAARAGAEVLATDADPEALELLERNARTNGVELHTATLDWGEPGDVDRFDLVLGADVLYERASVGLLLRLLPRLAKTAWIADPGRATSEVFLEQARRRWKLESVEAHGVMIHRIRLSPQRRVAR
jgi:predicted nicotinamide N-methyase